MRTVDRQGVHIEQCENCRGIFLDHGELELMTAAEDRFYGTSHYVPPGGHRGKPDSPRPYRGGHGKPDSPRPYRGGHGKPDSPRPYRGERHGDHYPDSPRPYGHGKQKKSFLGDLFG
jgi:Zn-finger nucleic acid-binding protein